MKFFPIIPIWLMIIISIVYIVLIIKTKDKKQLLIRIAIIILLFVINLKPMIGGGTQEVYMSNYDYFIVVDTTISMVAEDYQGNGRRLDAVKEDLQYILNKLPAGNYAIITYDNKSYVRVPLTFDRDMVNTILNTMDVKISYYATGSSISLFKDDLKYLLNSSKKKKDNRKRIVFIVSDGENTTDNSIDSLSDLKDLVDGGAILGYGTTEGGKMREKLFSTSTENEIVMDKRQWPYVEAISKIDENNLKKFASDLDIDYIHMDRQNAVDKVLNKIINAGELSKSDDTDSYQDIYFLFAIVLTILLLVELYYDKRKYL